MSKLISIINTIQNKLKKGEWLLEALICFFFKNLLWSIVKIFTCQNRKTFFLMTEKNIYKLPWFKPNFIMLTATYSRINGLIPSLFIPINPHPTPLKSVHLYSICEPNALHTYDIRLQYNQIIEFIQNSHSYRSSNNSA